MVEVPEHLLQRSRARRAALGLGGGEAAPEAPRKEEAKAESSDAPKPVARDESGAPTPAAEAAPRKPVTRPLSAPARAALSRPKVPWWAMPVLAFLPIWAVLYAGSLSPADTGEESQLDLGASVYASNCASCHGATGGGGAGPALAGGAVLETFPEIADHLHWVAVGSGGWPEETYGANKKKVAGGMPGWGANLTPEELLAVVRYEREVLGGEEVDPGLLAEDGSLLHENGTPWLDESGALVDESGTPLLDSSGNWAGS
ncbi:MAG: hypothetical protein KatS3mg008_1182 [Acidimicrobiales bacterium]|nr:MAG: hypothetical protein KatS3mg008_1182 [Acidimicrobiales bacterium]